jgi:hypothetical protein
LAAGGKAYDQTTMPVVGPETMAAAQRQQLQQAYQDARARALGEAAGRGLKSRKPVRHVPKPGEEGYGE